MEVQFDGMYAREDVLKAARLHYNPSWGIVYFRVALMGFVVLAYVLYLFLSGPIIYKDQLGIILPTLIILYVIGLPFLRPYELTSKFMKDPEARNPITGQASESGLIWQTILVQSEYKWEIFKRLVSKDDLCMLYQGDSKWFILIPRNFFRNETDWNDFVSLARSRISGEQKVGTQIT